MDAFPKAKIVKLDTVSGVAYSRKTDILKKLMWFAYEDNQTWIALNVDQVKEFMEDNKQGKQVPALQEVAAASQVMETVSMAQPEMIGNSELLSEDLELSAEIRRQREAKSRGNDRGRDRNRNPHSHNKPNPNRGGEQQNRPPHQHKGENRGPRPDRRGPRPPHPGNRNDRRGPGPGPTNKPD
jgi:hypothetical protein